MNIDERMASLKNKLDDRLNGNKSYTNSFNTNTVNIDSATNKEELMMFCPECGSKIPAESKFCSECGSKKPEITEWKCSCGAVNTGKFCSECGNKRG